MGVAFVPGVYEVREGSEAAMATQWPLKFEKPGFSLSWTVAGLVVLALILAPSGYFYLVFKVFGEDHIEWGGYIIFAVLASVVAILTLRAYRRAHFERGLSRGIAVEHPKARALGKEQGRDETLEVVSQGTILFAELPAGRYEILSVTPFGSDQALVIMRGDKTFGDRLVQMPRSVVETAAKGMGLDKGRYYEFSRDDGDPQFEYLR